MGGLCVVSILIRRNVSIKIKPDNSGGGILHLQCISLINLHVYRSRISICGLPRQKQAKFENKKMELAIPPDRVDVNLSFSERIIHLHVPHV